MSRCSNQNGTEPSTARLRRLTPVVIALMTAPLIVGVGPARANMFSWPEPPAERLDASPPPPAVPGRVARPPQGALKLPKPGHAKFMGHANTAQVASDTAKPHGPLVIAISIENQRLRVYDANGLFTESRVSTGMPGHATPMGVFSIIQKSKWHRSNIYSGAPMPYMQRITWSGVALHAGVVPNHPASHGCIRLPMAFAIKLWGWSKPGARVIITPGDVSPAEFDRPALLARIVPPLTTVTPADAPVAGTGHTAPLEAVHDEPGAVDQAGLPAGHLETSPAPVTLRSSLSDRIRVADAQTDGVVANNHAAAESSPVATLPSAAASTPVSSGAPVSAAAGSITNSAHGDLPSAAPLSADAGPTGAPKDQSRPAARAADAQPVQVPLAAAEPKRSGHVAVLISRKTGRLYVRQDFEPWFDVPVIIAQADRPLGTHVFTANATEPGGYRWSEVSLPLLPPRHDAAPDSSHSPRRDASATALPSSPTSAADALDRLTIPQEAAAKIAGAFATGGSIIVSDHGLGDETGLGTDFIVPLR